MKIWAHRGCSQRYPENTLTSFGKAADLLDRGLWGIELDIQRTADGTIVVIHDEKVNRTTDGSGFVRDYDLEGLKRLSISSVDGQVERIPTMEETLDLLEPHMRRGLMLNIELKTGVIHYDGIEEEIVEMVSRRGLQERVVYSSFYARSLDLLSRLAPGSELGVLDRSVSDCYYKARGLDIPLVLHPNGRQMDVQIEDAVAIRAWFSGHLYPEKPTGGRMDFARFESMGVTDVFLNEPEAYL